MLDHQQLLVPISHATPCGEDLSFSPEFDTIANARYADDPTLEQGAWQTDLKTADWPAVINLGNRLLQERSKDLRIAVWLTEAHTQVDGVAGLAWGYRLACQLCERFWDGLYPREDDDDDVLLRIAHIRWLLTHSERWVRDLAITQSAEGTFSANDFYAAHRRTDANDTTHTGRPTLDQVEAARRATPFEFYNELTTQLSDCLAALDELEQITTEKAGDDAPNFRPCRETIQDIADMVTRFIGGSTPPADTPDDGAPTADSSTETVAIARSNNGEINTRREALTQLRQVAAFFRRTEPHSPVAYLADKAAKWGEMPLHVWLRRVIKDEGALSHIEEMLDVDQDRSDDNGF